LPRVNYGSVTGETLQAIRQQVTANSGAGPASYLQARLAPTDRWIQKTR